VGQICPRKRLNGNGFCYNFHTSGPFLQAELQSLTSKSNNEIYYQIPKPRLLCRSHHRCDSPGGANTFTITIALCHRHAGARAKSESQPFLHAATQPKPFPDAGWR
jgi:hypothetical protein